MANRKRSTRLRAITRTDKSPGGLITITSDQGLWGSLGAPNIDSLSRYEIWYSNIQISHTKILLGLASRTGQTGKPISTQSKSDTKNTRDTQNLYSSPPHLVMG